MPSLSRAARIASVLTLTALVNAEDLSRRNTSPFFPAAPGLPPSRIQARQSNGNCPSNAHSCSSIQYPGFCCVNTAQCALDDARHIACCPNGISCSGTVAQNGNGQCNSGYYSCPDSLFDGGCCLSGYEYCSENRCINSGDAIVALVAAVPGLFTSAANGGIGIYRTLTDESGAQVTEFIGDAGAAYTSYVENPAQAAESWLGSAYTRVSTGITGFPLPTVSISVDPNVVSTVRDEASSVVSVVTSEYDDFRSNLPAWYASFRSKAGAGYTSFVNDAGQYVTTITSQVNGIPTQVAVTIQLPADNFEQAAPTGNAGARSMQLAFRGEKIGMGATGPAVLLWFWAIGLGLFTAFVGCL